MSNGLSDDHSGSLVSVSSVIDAIKRACAAEHAAGRSIVGSDPRYPSKLIEVAPDGQRFIVELEGEEGSRTFRRVAKVPAQEE